MSNFTINEGNILSKKGSISLKDVDYIVPRRGWILSQYIFIGSRNGSCVKIRVSDQEIEQILSALKKANAPVINNLDTLMEFNDATDTIKDGKNKRINKNNMWLTGDTVIFVPKRKVLKKDDNPVCINIKDVVFSTTQNVRKFGFLPLGYQTYFGTASNQAIFKHPLKDHGEQLNQHLVDNGSVIGTKASSVYKDSFWLGKLLSPLSFFKHEEIGLADDAITYKYKKGSKVENVFLPFNEISYIDMTKGTFHSNHIVIFGQQNIITRLQFSNKAIKDLKNTLIEKAIPVANKIIQPRTFLGLLHNPLAKRTIAVNSDKLIYSDTKSKYGISLPFDSITSIVWKKKYFFYFVGYLFVTGKIRNIRQDQAEEDEETMVMPKIWFTKKNFIKNLAPNAPYNKRNDKKLYNIENVKYS